MFSGILKSFMAFNLRISYTAFDDDHKFFHLTTAMAVGDIRNS